MLYDHACGHCDGTVREKLVERQAFKHRLGFVILEQVPIGVCDGCGTRYYHLSILRRVHDVATGGVTPDGTAHVPFARPS